MNTTQEEKTVKELFAGKCWQYLNDNFHKFNEPNKIKIALALVTKDMPQQISADMRTQIVSMPAIQKIYSPGEADGNPVARIAEFIVGTPPPA